jgi:signal-transduction protein with cAMP-binding, CBS, and nucleotidyltransferase domain
MANQYGNQHPLTVADVMLRAVTKVRRGTTLAEAVRQARQQGNQAIIVLPIRAGLPLSFISALELEQLLATQTIHSLRPVDEIARPVLFVVSPAMWAKDCTSLLLDANLRQAIVVQYGEPVGIVQITDLLQAIEMA